MSSRLRIFSLEEANALLPELEAIVMRLRKKKAANERLHDELFMEELLNEAVKRSEDLRLGTEAEARQLDHSVSDLEEDIRALRAFGCIVRNLERGWIEFFGKHQGAEVYYCWCCGEKSVQYYRSTQATFSQRQPFS